MPHAVHLVFSDVVSPAREDEFNTWYETVHIPEVCAIPGVVSARRFRLASQKSAFDGEVAHGNRYLVIYEIDAADTAAVEQQMQERFADGRLRPTDTMRADPPPVAVYFDEI
jgi:hypothetical protein